MKVTIAIDSLKGSLTSLEAGQAAAEGIRRVYEDADICIRPLAEREPWRPWSAEWAGNLKESR